MSREILRGNFDKPVGISWPDPWSGLCVSDVATLFSDLAIQIRREFWRLSDPISFLDITYSRHDKLSYADNCQ